MTTRSTAFRIVSLVVLLQLSGKASRAANFLSIDRQVVAAAEQARIHSARFWTGAELPGDWYRPCPITIQPAAHSGSGRTQFTFLNGEVFGWSMTVSGTREAVLADIIPHEVDHMVRASLVRHPIERWLDEGCASLMESDKVHARLRQTALNSDPRLITERWLTQQHYPDDPIHTAQLYALGFSLVEFLIDRSSPNAVLQFQRDPQPLAQRLRNHFNLSVTSLRAEWSDWRQRRYAHESPGHSGGHTHHPDCRCSNPPDTLLEIWTASWCGPCRKFWSDWEQDPEFRATLTSRFHIHVVDIDQHPELATRRHITSVPTFLWTDGRSSGYTDKTTLLSRLPMNVAEEQGTNGETPQRTELHAPDETTPSQKSPPVDATDASTHSPAAPPKTSPTPVTQLTPRQGRARTVLETLANLLPFSVTALQWAGIISGCVASGGIGGIVLSTGLALWRRRRQRLSGQPVNSLQLGGKEGTVAVPFPRQLDEARQLLGLRQSEGRVAVLDALRGMFFDDEVEKLTASAQPPVTTALNELRDRIDARVDEVAPLSTRFDKAS